ncbi:hypothetical protein Tsubulata_017492 [Turnera subulata]|uniref:Arf-GAP domain-containing protein n=1 Tax=Turnera subulata TaxID=218843 RepID=A0A9Q0F439_9ROSI|nr:hypothetical protein Tsubulata_017492 [Turnera subulata]
MTCSGIHREFTHRVKSVSMSKFTSQEVEALQNGGNQRAREIYLKDWDQQRQRLPDNSNADKVREFIKHVYVDRRYTGGKTSDKPPKDMQSNRSHEDETRRASSYHSFSQSPPYDFQYEDRRYGKQATTLTRKPGSDRGLYVGKMSSFICSPTRLSDRMPEDRFANEGSFSRASDYSVSSGCDSARHGTESPNFQKDFRSTSLPLHPSREAKSATSLGSIGSFDSKSMSPKSYNSGSFVDFVSENEQIAGALHDRVSPLPPLSATVSHGSLDLFDTSVVPGSSSSTGAPIDLFQLPATSAASSMDLFQSSQANSVPSMITSQHTKTSLTSSLGLSAGSGIVGPQPDSALDNKSESAAPKNEGWATFDVPQPAASSPGIGNLAHSVVHSAGGLSPEFDHVSSLNTNMQWPLFENSSGQSATSAPQHVNLVNVQAFDNSANAQVSKEWNAFENSVPQLSVGDVKQSSEPQAATYKTLSAADHYFGPNIAEDFNEVGNQRDVHYGAHTAASGPSDTVLGSSSIRLNPMEETQSYADHKSTNPFDFPCDSEVEPGDMFLDVSSLHAALPNTQLTPTFLGGVTDSWFTQDPMMTYIPSGPQGSLAYMAHQAPGSPLGNVQAQGPVASVGGNPFA